MTASAATHEVSPARPALIALGSNLGDRLAMLRGGLECLRREPGVRVVRASPIFETAPEGGPAELRYLNACAVLDVTLDARALLDRLLAIERHWGRVRTVRDAPRTLDLDLLLLGDMACHDADLTLPHPRMLARAFVLEPAATIAPAWIHPQTGRTLLDHLRDLGPPPPLTPYAHFDGRHHSGGGGSGSESSA